MHTAAPDQARSLGAKLGSIPGLQRPHDGPWMRLSGRHGKLGKPAGWPVDAIPDPVLNTDTDRDERGYPGRGAACGARKQGASVVRRAAQPPHINRPGRGPPIQYKASSAPTAGARSSLSLSTSFPCLCLSVSSDLAISLVFVCCAVVRP